MDTPDSRFNLRLPADELAAWQALADAETLTVSQLVRRTMLAAVKRAKKQGILGSEKKATG